MNKRNGEFFIELDLSNERSDKTACSTGWTGIVMPNALFGYLRNFKRPVIFPNSVTFQTPCHLSRPNITVTPRRVAIW